MRRIQLYLTKGVPRHFVDQDARDLAVSRDYILGLLRIPGDPTRIRECLVDTGAPLTVFPERIWRDFEDRIGWLTRRGGESIEWAETVRGLTGGSCPSRLGAIEVGFVDLDRNESQLTTIVAKFSRDGDYPEYRLSRILLGLNGMVWRQRRLIVNHDSQQAYFEEP